MAGSAEFLLIPEQSERHIVKEGNQLPGSYCCWDHHQDKSQSVIVYLAMKARGDCSLRSQAVIPLIASGSYWPVGWRDVHL